MLGRVSRRRFVAGLGSVAAATALPIRTPAGVIEPVLFSSGAASSFTPFSPSRPEIRFGYAAITWGGDDARAITDIGEVGFHGIQLRSNVLKDFGDKPNAIADMLKKNKLTFVALSGGGPRNDAYDEAEEMATQVKHASFLRAAGGLYLQMTDSARPKDRKPEPKDFKALGRLLTNIGKRTADLGVPMAYHNHMRSLGEAPGEVDALMDAADPRYVKLLLDVAHYAQGGGDPATAIREHRDRILFLHIKDVETIAPAPGDRSAASYRFVELGRGRVDLQAVFAALKETGFGGWCIVELDSVPDKTRTPKESAIISKKYLEDKLAIRL